MKTLAHRPISERRDVQEAVLASTGGILCVSISVPEGNPEEPPQAACGQVSRVRRLGERRLGGLGDKREPQALKSLTTLCVYYIL